MLKEGAPFGPHRAFPPGLYSNSCGPGTKQYRAIVEYCNKGVRRNVRRDAASHDEWFKKRKTNILIFHCQAYRNKHRNMKGS